MKKTALVALAIMTLCTMTALAASSNSTTTLSVAVAAGANISVPATTTLIYAGTFPTGTYSGATTVTFSCRTTRVGGTGDIKLQATSATWTAAGGATTGPLLTDVTYGAAAGSYAGVGVYAAAGTAISNGVDTNVLTGLGANNRVNGKTITTTFSMGDNPNWETDTYTLPIKFTLTAL
jgi:hypothetical protein